MNFDGSLNKNTEFKFKQVKQKVFKKWKVKILQKNLPSKNSKKEIKVKKVK